MEPFESLEKLFRRGGLIEKSVDYLENSPFPKGWDALEECKSCKLIAGRLLMMKRPAKYAGLCTDVKRTIKTVHKHVGMLQRGGVVRIVPGVGPGPSKTIVIDRDATLQVSSWRLAHSSGERPAGPLARYASPDRHDEELRTFLMRWAEALDPMLPQVGISGNFPSLAATIDRGIEEDRLFSDLKFHFGQIEERSNQFMNPFAAWKELCVRDEMARTTWEMLPNTYDQSLRTVFIEEDFWTKFGILALHEALSHIARWHTLPHPSISGVRREGNEIRTCAGLTLFRNRGEDASFVASVRNRWISLLMEALTGEDTRIGRIVLLLMEIQGQQERITRIKTKVRGAIRELSLCTSYRGDCKFRT